MSEETGGETTKYLYGLDLLGHLQSGTPVYYGYDALSLRLHVNNQGEIADEYRYGPFGEVVGEGVHGYGFTGERWDEDTGLLYLRARYYAPGMGRFVSRDPLSGQLNRPRTLHRFVYVLNNPVEFVDPRGLQCDIVTGECWYFGGETGMGWTSTMPNVASYAPLSIASPAIPALPSSPISYVPAPTPSPFTPTPTPLPLIGTPTPTPMQVSVSDYPQPIPTPGPPELLDSCSSWTCRLPSPASYNPLEAGGEMQMILGCWLFQLESCPSLEFGPYDAYTQLLMHDVGIANARRKYAAQGCPPTYKTDAPISKAASSMMMAKIQENFQLLVFMHGGCFFARSPEDAINPLGATIGSYDVYITDLGDGTVQFRVVNVTGRESFTRVPVNDLTKRLLGWSEFGREMLQRKALLPNKRRQDALWGGNMREIFVWTEPIPCPRALHSLWR